MAAIPGLGALSAVGAGAVGIGVGFGISPAVHPLVQEIANEAWSLHPDRPLDPSDAATLAAELYAGGHANFEEAGLNGVSEARFAALTELATTAPDLGTLLELARRNLISDENWLHGLHKARLSPEYESGLKVLQEVLLAPADLANARQQGFVSPERQRAESALQGVNGERADILFELSGLPPGPETAQEAYNRGLIDDATFAQIIREGHTKTKYTDLLKTLREPVLPPAVYAEGHLREWIGAGAMNAGGALSGLSPEQMDLLFKVRGRPATPHQMFLSQQRGLGSRADFDRAIAQSNIRPEYADNLWQVRFSYPSLFQMRQLVTSGAISDATAALWLKYTGYEPGAAAEMIAGWKDAKTAPEKDLVKGEILALYGGGYVDAGAARTMLASLGYDASEQGMLLSLADAQRARRFLDAALTLIRTLYVGYRIDRSEAVTRIDALGISSRARDDALELWTIEREANVRDLTGPQILHAFTREQIDAPTATAKLEQIGYSPEDAALLVRSA